MTLLTSEKIKGFYSFTEIQDSWLNILETNQNVDMYSAMCKVNTGQSLYLTMREMQFRSFNSFMMTPDIYEMILGMGYTEISKIENRVKSRISLHFLDMGLQMKNKDIAGLMRTWPHMFFLNFAAM